VKSLIGSALVGFSVRQHARAESISKRAPSTTRTFLRFRINKLRSGQTGIIAHAIDFSLPFIIAFGFSHLHDACAGIGRELCQTSHVARSLSAISLRLRKKFSPDTAVAPRGLRSR
jgi:hypothetical protein